jgi:hypothetical protein
MIVRSRVLNLNDLMSIICIIIWTLKVLYSRERTDRVRSKCFHVPVKFLSHFCEKLFGFAHRIEPIPNVCFIERT